MDFMRSLKEWFIAHGWRLNEEHLDNLVAWMTVAWLKRVWRTPIKPRVLWGMAEKMKRQKTSLLFLCSNDPASNQTSKFKTNKGTCQKKKKVCWTGKLSEAGCSSKKELEVCREGNHKHTASSQGVLQASYPGLTLREVGRISQGNLSYSYIRPWVTALGMSKRGCWERRIWDWSHKDIFTGFAFSVHPFLMFAAQRSTRVGSEYANTFGRWKIEVWGKPADYFSLIEAVLCDHTWFVRTEPMSCVVPNK